MKTTIKTIRSLIKEAVHDKTLESLIDSWEKDRSPETRAVLLDAWEEMGKNPGVELIKLCLSWYAVETTTSDYTADANSIFVRYHKGDKPGPTDHSNEDWHRSLTYQHVRKAMVTGGFKAIQVTRMSDIWSWPRGYVIIEVEPTIAIDGEMEITVRDRVAQ